ncbi:MAG TPA: hypothetical protein VJO35_06435 [Terriglobales bacterium]|nr:hypothetical protein [Terriglobales bacterium]
MNRTALFRTLLALSVAVALSAMPQSAVAQRGGGHAGFGGFHGGSIGGFHGSGFRGGNFGGFHNGAFGGFHNGAFNGFRGPGFGGFREGFGRRRFWGYPGFGWGLNVGFGFGPYWAWDYPYYYGWPWWNSYASYYPYPDQYPYYAPPSGDDRCDYRYSDRCSDDRRNDDRRNDDRQNDDRQNGSPDSSRPSRPSAPARPASTTVLENSSSDYRMISSEDYRRGVDSAPASSSTHDYSFTNLKTLQAPSHLRPAVRNVVQALRAMPPAVREQQLSSGRYASLSGQEKGLLEQLVQRPERQ